MQDDRPVDLVGPHFGAAIHPAAQIMERGFPDPFALLRAVSL
jgi:hypothetical protein